MGQGNPGVKRVLVVGMPRSGTTWVGRVLAAALGTELLDEPDNHFVSPYAFRVKRRLEQGSYPRLRANDDAPEYASLWNRAFGIEANGLRLPAMEARRRISRELLQRTKPTDVTRAIAGTMRPRVALHIAERLAVPEQPPAHARAVVVKSVYAALAVEWIGARCAPRVVVVLRHPLNVLSSWVELGWLVDDPLEPLEARLRLELAQRYGTPSPSTRWSRLERAAWLAGALTSALGDLGDVPGQRVLVTHESLSQSREEGFHRIVSELELGWDPRATRLLSDLDRPGGGFDTTRVSGDVEHAWRARLSPVQVREARSILDAFPAGQPWQVNGNER